MVLADAIHRWQKMKNVNVQLFTGTDEHGLKVYQSAIENGFKNTTKWVDHVSHQFKDLTNQLNVLPTRFVRTTDADHINCVKTLWLKLLESDDIYKGEHSGWYSVSDESFFADHEIIDDDQGQGKVTKDTGKKVIFIHEKNYMFRLSKYRDAILHWLTSKEIIHPRSRLHDILGYLNDPNNFTDISVSRSVDSVKWGILVPSDSKHPDQLKDQMIYVWLDALSNYLTVSDYPLVKKVPDIYVLGKDILKYD